MVSVTDSDSDSETRLKGKRYFIVLTMLVIYLMAYSLGGMWLLFDGWINQFSSIYWVWGIEENVGFQAPITLIIYSTVGAVLGSSILSITSFHKYLAVEKSLDEDHFLGFIFSPVLAAIVGVIVFTLFQGGLLVLSGPIGEGKEPFSAALGFTAIGCIAGYNWEVVIKKIQELSKTVLSKSTVNEE